MLSDTDRAVLYSDHHGLLTPRASKFRRIHLLCRIVFGDYPDVHGFSVIGYLVQNGYSPDVAAFAQVFHNSGLTEHERRVNDLMYTTSKHPYGSVYPRRGLMSRRVTTYLTQMNVQCPVLLRTSIMDHDRIIAIEYCFCGDDPYTYEPCRGCNRTVQVNFNDLWRLEELRMVRTTFECMCVLQEWKGGRSHLPIERSQWLSVSVMEGSRRVYFSGQGTCNFRPLEDLFYPLMCHMLTTRYNPVAPHIEYEQL